MVGKYVFGSPVETGAILEQIPLSEGKIPHFDFDGRTFSCKLGENDVVYGLGEAVRGINKRGWRYESCCSDDMTHTEDKRSLYGAHNFVVVDGAEKFGAFFDVGCFVTFDVGCSDRELLTVTPDYEGLYVYIIGGESAEDVIKQFRALIGQSYIPPRWAFGAIQSRWGYENEADIRAVADKYAENQLPLDGICLDIDYMERYKDFTVDKEKFPDFPGLCRELKENGVHLIPIIDAGVKIEDGYDVYEEGREKNLFCKRADGTDFVAGVWPGRTHFPDFLNPRAREWFGEKYRALLDMGVDGFWNDMNEPAIFYSDEGLEAAKEKYGELISKPLDVNGFFALQWNFNSLNNNREDYRRFFHSVGDEKIVHERVHNLYGFNMTRAAGECFEKLDRRVLMFSRASYIGMHRYGGIWTGDNRSWWSHILLNLKMLPSLNMCGFLYVGADTGGFASDTTGDLLLRWTQLSIFTPLLRNHSAKDTILQEPYRFPQYLDGIRAALELRTRLVPYLYSVYMDCALSGKMMFRPLAFEFPEDKTAAGIEDQLLLGDELMIAPVYEQNARGRYVYLPEKMLLVRYCAKGLSCEITPAGAHYVYIALGETVFFIRKNCFIPLAAAALHTKDINTQSLTLLGFAEGETELSFALYEDDGYSRDFGAAEHYNKLSVAVSAGGAKAFCKGKTLETAIFCENS